MTPPAWLQAVAVVSLSLAVLSAVVLAVSVTVAPQRMWIMNLVWPITALYWGPVAVWAYFAFGRSRSDGRPMRQSTFIGTSHCGAGCTLGDIAGEWLVFLSGLTIAGSKLGAYYLADFALAFALGILFQYYSIAPMRGLGVSDGIIAALKADTISITAFEIGMFAWMYLSHQALLPGLEPTNLTYWFMMQIAMIVGFATSYPANWFLVRTGLKEAM